MNTFAVLFFCIQACLVQNIFSQCIGSYGAEVINNSGFGYSTGLTSTPGLSYRNSGGLGCGSSLGIPAFRSNTGFGYEAAEVAAFGGVGEGNVAVTGELPVGGDTAIIGQVPILGAVSFGGNLPATGAVSVNGRCVCCL